MNMYCLHCGDCCLRMSPISAPEPCPHLIQDEAFYFCGIYERRPDQCYKHAFPSRFCPVGMSKFLGLDTLDKIRQRIDEGWSKIKRIEVGE